MNDDVSTDGCKVCNKHVCACFDSCIYLKFGVAGRGALLQDRGR